MIETIDGKYIEQLCLEYGLKLNSILIWTLMSNALYYMIKDYIPLIKIKSFTFDIKSTIETILMGLNTYIVILFLFEKFPDFFKDNMNTMLIIGGIIIFIILALFLKKNWKQIRKTLNKWSDGLNE